MKIILMKFMACMNVFFLDLAYPDVPGNNAGLFLFRKFSYFNKTDQQMFGSLWLLLLKKRGK